MKSSLWVERYRPRTLNDVIFQNDRQKKQFEQYIEDGDIPNLFLFGIQGTGKTTVSGALIRDLGVPKGDVLRINCSDEKIDAMRSKVASFAMTLPLGKLKIVQLEEMDYLSLDAQALLRGLIEGAAPSTRFIATCNYANRVTPPLKSRFGAHFGFKAPNKDQIALRVAEILEKEKVSFEVDDLLFYVDVAYPDIRATINLVNSNIQNKKLLAPENVDVTAKDWKFGLLEHLISGDLKGARKLVCESATREEHIDVYRFLYENLSKMKVADKDAAVLIIADYLYKHNFLDLADTEINLAACFIALDQL